VYSTVLSFVTNPVQCIRSMEHQANARGWIQKSTNWPPGARTANGTALCHYVQLYRYFMSQSSKFCRHNPLLLFIAVSVYFVIDLVRKLLDSPSYAREVRYLNIKLMGSIINLKTGILKTKHNNLSSKHTEYPEPISSLSRRSFQCHELHFVSYSTPRVYLFSILTEFSLYIFFLHRFINEWETDMEISKFIYKS
jgi:hypothetical protein